MSALMIIKIVLTRPLKIRNDSETPNAAIITKAGIIRFARTTFGRSSNVSAAGITPVKSHAIGMRNKYFFSLIPSDNKMAKPKIRNGATIR